MKMKIDYTDLEMFHEGVVFLAKRGITFEADAYNLVIELTGGY